MGREWYRVRGGRSSKTTKRESKPNNNKNDDPTTISGCMNALFHLFHFHHSPFPLINHSSLPPVMESTEEAPLSPIRRDNILNLTIKTQKTRSSKLESLTSSEVYSPSTKTPSLVARLMGLDLLPDKSLTSPSLSSPSSSCSSALSIDLGTSNLRTRQRHQSLRRNSVDGGTRSLPETPRISLGRRSDADCYQQRRLSLRINRDIDVSESERHDHMHVRHTSSRLKQMKLNDDKENRSPREYARQIVMQLKESVNRRMGTDITNTTKNRERARDHHLHHHHHNRGSKNTASDSSPRLRYLENTKAKPNSPKPPSPPSQTNVTQTVEDRVRLQTVQEEPQKKQGQEQARTQERETRRKTVMKKCKKLDKEPFVRSPVGIRSSSSSNLRHHHHLQGDKKCKRTVLSNDLLNFTSVSSLLPVKKKEPSNLNVNDLKVNEAQTPRHRASEFPRCRSQTQTHTVRKGIATSTASISAAELDYITRALQRTGIYKDTPISNARWFSPSHPRHNPVRSRWNLLRGSELIDELCRRIGQFPLSGCQVLEEIDALVARDLSETEAQRDLELEEESEGIVTELERQIIETLVSETAGDYVAERNVVVSGQCVGFT